MAWALTGLGASLWPETFFYDSYTEREKLMKNRGGFGVEFGSGQAG